MSIHIHVCKAALYRLITNSAQRHGRDSEPDHEVGDLQETLGVFIGLLTPKQLVIAMQTTLKSDNVTINSNAKMFERTRTLYRALRKKVRST